MYKGLVNMYKGSVYIKDLYICIKGQHKLRINM